MKSFLFQYRLNEIRLRIDQVTTRNLGRHFKLNLQDVYIKESFGDCVEFPQESNGQFAIENYEDGHNFTVHGTPIDPNNVNQNQSSNSPPVSNQWRMPSSSSTSTSRGARRVPLASVKVIRADLGESGKPTNMAFHNLAAHINLYTEGDANVTFIKTKVKEEMHCDDLIIVGSNGLVLLDQDGTRGLEFWKVGSRKYYAVTSSSIEERRQRARQQPTTSKRKRSNDNNASDGDLEGTLEMLIDQVSETKEEIKRYGNLAFKNRFSLSFIAAFEDAFKCSICHKSPAQPPLIACSACSSLVGCQTCTNEWYKEGSLAKVCPKCRGQRGLTKTFVLRGFDDVVSQLQQMQATSSSESAALSNENDQPTSADRVTSSSS